MTRDELFGKLFDAEFCDPEDKAEKEAEYNRALDEVCQSSGTPRYALEMAVRKRYPIYRSERLRKELPSIPPEFRGEQI